MSTISYKLNLNEDENEIILELSYSNSIDADTLFKKISEIFNKDYIVEINFSDVRYVEGNLYQYLYNFPKLREITACDGANIYFIDELELFYNKNIIINNKFILEVNELIQFYKNHQDDPYYQHEMIKSGLFNDKQWDRELMKLFYNDVVSDYKIILKSKNGTELDYSVRI